MSGNKKGGLTPSLTLQFFRKISLIFGFAQLLPSNFLYSKLPFSCRKISAIFRTLFGFTVRLIRDFIAKFFFLLNFLAGLYALLVFQISYAADIKHWLGGFLMLSVPVAFAVNLFFLFFYAFSGSLRALLSLIVLVIGYPLIERTIKFSLRSDEEVDGQRISLLSYNVMYCDYGAAKNENRKQGVQDLTYGIDTLSADIKCFQEFYNKDDHPFLNTIRNLKDENPYFTYMHSEIDPSTKNGAIGLATFSKYPILKKQEISYKINNNGVLITDILVNADTIRVFNIQLKSMGIRVHKVITSNEEVRNKETKNILSQLKSGFEDRSLQVDEIEELIQKSPYPVIVAGDFNELPYGYAYGRVKKHLDNAFEEAGFGFGFTYHKLPSFLRIDNIFCDSDHFEVLKFETLKELENSDHYPIKAEFRIRN